jgi:O-antigen/teichoic acid export membrane protein
LILIIICKAAQFLLALLMLRVATTLLSPEEMGKVSLILTTIAFFAMFLINPVGMFINRRLHAWQENGQAITRFVQFTGYIAIVALVAAIVLPLIVMNNQIKFGITTGWLVALVCGSLILNTINQTAIPSLNLLGDNRGFLTLSLATLAASFICAMILVETAELSATFWVLGLIIGQGIIAIIGTNRLLKKLKNNKSTLINKPRLWKKKVSILFGFAWPVAIAAGLGWVQAQGYRYILENQIGLTQLGLFVAGYSISAGIIAGFESVLTTYFQPRLYRNANKDDVLERAKAWRSYASAVMPPLILTSILIVMLAPELTHTLLGERFQASSEFIVWGVLAESARVLTGVYSLIAHVLMRTRWLVWPSIIGAVIAIASGLILIPRLGAIGAGISLTLAGSVVIAILHIYLAPKVGANITVRTIGKVSAAGILLWLFSLIMRQLDVSNDWIYSILIIGMTGTLYLGLLYAFLRSHLLENEKK